VRSNTRSNMETSSVTLREASAKLRGLGYLIENHHDEVGEPLDIDDIRWGIGLLLTELSGTIRRIAVQLDENLLNESHKKKS
jgi:hypothetical protein